MAPLERAMVVS